MRKKHWRFILLVLAALFLVKGAFVFSVYLGAWGSIPGGEELRQVRNATATLVLSSEEELIGKYFSENRTNIDSHQLPEHLSAALVATEDRRFHSHRGFDTRSFIRVLLKNVLFNDRGAGGGSTISQQLAKNLFGRADHGTPGIFVNKTREIIIARRIENTLSKEEILLLYLNTVPFGENLYGVESAANRFFSKATGQLRIEESAVLVGMLKANTSYNPRLFPDRSRSRRNTVLYLMMQQGFIGAEEADSLASLPLEINYSVIGAGSNLGYFLDHVKSEARGILIDYADTTGEILDLDSDGLTIGTTLNMKLQEFAYESFREHLSVMQDLLDAQYRTAAGSRQFDGIAERELRKAGIEARVDDVRLMRVFDWDGPYMDSLSVADSLRHALGLLHAGLLAIDPHSGAIEAYAGGIDYISNPYNQITARRQLASAFKPILFAAALEDGIEPCTYLDNDSLIITDYPGYSPANHDRSLGGRWSMAGALSYSMNIPAFNLFLLTGYESVASLWKDMGFSRSLQNLPSLAMGTAEASIWEVASAYSAFANGGYAREPYTIEYIADADGRIIYNRGDSAEDHSGKVISDETGMIIRHMLEMAVNKGTASAIRTRFGVQLPVAAKTGTSQNYSDAWLASFGPGLVMVSRVGASIPAVGFDHGHYGSASALALPIVGITLGKMQGDPGISERYFADGFPALPAHIAAMIDCPDHIERRRIERFFDLFRSSEVTFDKEKEESSSWLRRIFKSDRDR